MIFSQMRALPRSVLAFVLARAIASVGAAIAYFALDVWIFRATGSYTAFAVIAALCSLPGLLLAPIAGTLVDSHPGKGLLIVCDAITATAALSLAVVSWFGELTPVHAGAVAVVLATIRSVVWPAVWSNVTRLTPVEQRPRINGYIEAAEGAVGIFCPMLGAFVLEATQFSVVFAIPLIAAGFCICLTVMIRFPLVVKTSAAPMVATSSVIQQLIADSTFGFRWICARPSLVRLLCFFMITNLSGAIYAVAYAPYILSFGSPTLLATCMALAGAGIMMGGVLFGATGGFKRQEIGVLVGSLIEGGCMVAAGLSRSSLPLLLAALVFGMSIPLSNASSQTIWQASTPTEVIGRVFSTRRMIAWGLNPLSILISVPMAAEVFAPILQLGWGDWNVAQLWGWGQTGALGLMISACGLLCSAISVFLLSFDGLRITPGAPIDVQAGALSK